MLNSLRKGANTWVAKLLLGLLIASFAVWGMADVFTDPQGQSVATVGEEKVGAQEFLNEYQRELSRMQQRFGVGLTTEQAQSLGLEQQVLSRLVGRAMYRADAAQLGITSSDDAVKQAIIDMEAFRDPVTGTFSRGSFDTALFGSGLTEAGFIDLLRDDLTRTQIVNGLVSGGLAPGILSESLYKVQAEQRIMRFFTVPGINPEDLEAPEDSALRAFYDERKVRYTAPEYRTVTFLTATPADLVDTMNVAQEELTQEYEFRLDSLRQDETVTIDQIRLADEATAQTAFSRLSAGEEAALVAGELADLTAEDIRLTDITRASLEQDYANAIFAAGQGGVSEPVETAFGWMVSVIVELTEARTPPLEEVRDAIETDLKLQKAQDRLFEMSNEIEDERAGGLSLEEVAQRMSLNILTVPAIDANGLDENGDAVAGLPASQGLIADIFDQDIGQENDIQETVNGGYFVTRVDDITDARQQDFEEVVDQVRTDWLVEEADRLSAEAITALKDRLDRGETMTDLAAETGTEPQVSQPVTRDQTVPGAGPEAVTLLFDLLPDESATSRTLAGDRVLFRLIDIVAANPINDRDGYTEMRRAATNAIANEWVQQYERALQSELGVAVNRSRINLLLNPEAR